MLAKIAPASHDFYALARYLVSGKAGRPHPDRVAWTLGHNLADNDPELAAKVMTATAGLSARTRKAAYHLMIAWHRDEQPTPGVMQSIAVKTLDLAGLSDHQALIMGHGDRPHKHLHMLINRVHPESGKAWKTSHDYARFDHIMALLSDEFGFRYVPSHAYNSELTDDLPKKPNSRATYAAKRGAQTHRLQWSTKQSRAFGARLSETFDGQCSWNDLIANLGDYGLELEEKGGGLVVGDANSYTKLSALGLTKTAKGFQRRPVRTSKRQQTFTDGQRGSPIFSVDGVDIARAFVMLGLADPQAIRDAVCDAVAKRDSWAPVLDQLIRQARSHTVLSTTKSRPTFGRQHRPKSRSSRSARQGL